MPKKVVEGEELKTEESEFNGLREKAKVIRTFATEDPVSHQKICCEVRSMERETIAQGVSRVDTLYSFSIYRILDRLKEDGEPMLSRSFFPQHASLIEALLREASLFITRARFNSRAGHPARIEEF